MKKRVADIIIDTLIENGITNAFSVVGGGAMHLNNAFALKQDKIKTVYNHHEQASTMAAEGYAKLTGKMAAVCVTSGPGGLNTLNGVHAAWVDSAPLIVISGHPRYDTTVEASGLDVRCIGVQENDIIPQVKNITKFATMIKNPLDVRRDVQQAIDLALDGRRGPVWISVPLDVQGMQVEESELTPCVTVKKKTENKKEEIEALLCALKEAKRPCILTGTGIRFSGAHELYREFLKKVDLPIVGGIFATDANYQEETNYYGGSGGMGPRLGNYILQNADMILVLGNSLSTNQTGFNVEGFAPGADVYMVDAQADEAKKPGLHVKKCIEMDLKEFFKRVSMLQDTIQAQSEWKDYCDFLRERLTKYEVLKYLPKDEEAGVHPSFFWKHFLEQIEQDAVIALGNSSCVYGILQESVIKSEQRVIDNYHSGSMGIDLPFAIGAAVAEDRPIYCVTGDGCIMMNLQELQTIKYNRWKIKVIIFSNHGYDNIRNTCDNYFDGVHNGCDESSGISMPDFAKVANAFSFKYRKIIKTTELPAAILWLKNEETPCILEIEERKNKERAPIIKSVMDENGQFFTPPLHEMYPPLSAEEMKQYSRYIEEQEAEKQK